METALTWVLTTISVSAVVLNIKKNRLCFVLFLIANAGWIAVNVKNGIYAQAALFVVYTFLSIWGLIEWSRRPPR